MPSTIDSTLLARIIRRLPQSLLDLRIDEVIAMHFADELESELGAEFNPAEFLAAALTDDHFKSIIRKDNPYSNYRREHHICTKCRKHFITAADRDRHDCKPVAPTIKLGRTAIDLNKL